MRALIALIAGLVVACGPATPRATRLAGAPAASWQARARLVVAHQGGGEERSVTLIGVGGTSVRVVVDGGGDATSQGPALDVVVPRTGTAEPVVANLDPRLSATLVAVARSLFLPPIDPTLDGPQEETTRTRGELVVIWSGDPLLPRRLVFAEGVVEAVDWRPWQDGLLPRQIRAAATGVGVTLELTAPADLGPID